VPFAKPRPLVHPSLTRALQKLFAEQRRAAELATRALEDASKTARGVSAALAEALATLSRDARAMASKCDGRV
jgi:hypothetical protein